MGDKPSETPSLDAMRSSQRIVRVIAGARAGHAKAKAQEAIDKSDKGSKGGKHRK